MNRLFKLIVIGCSAGGFDALNRIFQKLPGTFRIPIAVAIHLPPAADSSLRMVSTLEFKAQPKVKEAEDKEPIANSTIYIAPSDYHLLIEPSRTFSLSCDPEVNFSRPSIDVLFESAASVYGNELLAIVLTGSNNDGANGVKMIIEQGGRVLVENPATAAFATMPEAAMKWTDVQSILSLNQIIATLLELR